MVGVQSPASRTQQGKHGRREEKGGAGRHTKALSALEPSSSVSHLRPASPLHGPHGYAARSAQRSSQDSLSWTWSRHGRGPRAARVPATWPRPVPGSAWSAAPRTLPRGCSRSDPEEGARQPWTPSSPSPRETPRLPQVPPLACTQHHGGLAPPSVCGVASRHQNSKIPPSPPALAQKKENILALDLFQLSKIVKLPSRSKRPSREPAGSRGRDRPALQTLQ